LVKDALRSPPTPLPLLRLFERDRFGGGGGLEREMRGDLEQLGFFPGPEDALESEFKFEFEELSSFMGRSDRPIEEDRDTESELRRRQRLICTLAFETLLLVLGLRLAREIVSSLSSLEIMERQEDLK